MVRFDENALDRFYSKLSQVDGVKISWFQKERARLYSLPRSEQDKKNARLSKNPWKKLVDEVNPVSWFLRNQGIRKGRIRFPLDDNIPDCWLWTGGDKHPIGIEVTVALGKARHHMMDELNKEGIGRGFLGLADSAEWSEFSSEMAQPPEMHSTSQALDLMSKGLIHCIEKKNDKRGMDGVDLLIAANLIPLPEGHWDCLQADMRKIAQSTRMREIHVICGTGNGFQVK